MTRPYVTHLHRAEDDATVASIQACVESHLQALGLNYGYVPRLDGFLVVDEEDVGILISVLPQSEHLESNPAMITCSHHWLQTFIIPLVRSGTG